MRGGSRRGSGRGTRFVRVSSFVKSQPAEATAATSRYGVTDFFSVHESVGNRVSVSADCVELRDFAPRDMHVRTQDFSLSK